MKMSISRLEVGLHCKVPHISRTGMMTGSHSSPMCGRLRRSGGMIHAPVAPGKSIKSVVEEWGKIAERDG